MKNLAERRRRSARETFAACRRKYQAEYLESVDMSSEFTRRGNAFAAAKARYLSALFSAKLTDDADLAQEAISWARVNTPGLTHEQWLDLEQLWSRFAPDYRMDLSRFYSVEGEQPCFDTVLRFDEVEVTDADTLTIIDDKSHWRIIPQAQLEQSFQLAFYLAAARRIFPGFRVYRFVFRFVRYGVLSDPIVLDNAALDLVEQAIRESDEAMAQAEDVQLFPATGGRACSTCSLAGTCDATWERQNLNATGLIQHLAALDRARALALAPLREDVDRDGPQRGGGIEWAHRNVTRKRFPLTSIVQDMTDDGEEVPEIMVSQTNIKPLLTKKFAAWRDFICQRAVESTSTEFSGKPIAGDEDAEQEAE